MTEKTLNIIGMSLEKKECQLVTKAICNKGFRGNSSILPRSNFGVGGQESSPQSLSVHTANVTAKSKGTVTLDNLLHKDKKTK